VSDATHKRVLLMPDGTVLTRLFLEAAG